MKPPHPIVLWLCILAYVLLAVLEAAYEVLEAMIHELAEVLERFERGTR